MLTKNNKLIKKITVSIVVIAIILVFAYIRYHSKDNNMPRIASYNGSNNDYSITFTRYLDFKSFLNAKPPNIWIYDTEDELNPNTGFIVGELLIKDTDTKEGNTVDLFQSCNIELIRKSEWNTSTTTMNFEEPKDGISKFSFTAYDFDDSVGNIYKTAMLTIGEREVPIELSIAK